MTGTAWKLGVGQDAREERAEIERAKIEGRADEYIAAQAERDRRQQARPEPRPQRRPGRRSDPVPVPVVIGSPDSEGNAILADHAAGLIEPIPVAVPANLPPAVERVARFVALFTGCRLSCGDDRPVPLGQAWVGARTGMSPATARRCLAALVQAGFLAPAGAMPTRGRPNGTNLFEVVGYTATTDEAPASSEAAPTPTLLLERATQRAEHERDAALWLACQLRDHGYDEHTVAHEIVCDYAAATGLSLSEALRSLRHAYGRPGREPWDPPGSHRTPEPSTEPGTVPVEAEHVTGPGWSPEPDREPPDQGGVIHAQIRGGGLPVAIAPGHAARQEIAHTPTGYGRRATGRTA